MSQQFTDVQRPADLAPSADPQVQEQNAKVYEDNYMLGAFGTPHKFQLAGNVDPAETRFVRETKSMQGWNAIKVAKAVEEGYFIPKYRNAKGGKTSAVQPVKSLAKRIVDKELVALPWVARSTYNAENLSRWLVFLGQIWNHRPNFRSVMFPGIDQYAPWDQVANYVLTLIHNSMKKMTDNPQIYTDYVSSNGNTPVRLIGKAVRDPSTDAIMQTANNPADNQLIATLIVSGIGLGTVPLSTFVKVHFVMWLLHEQGIFPYNINEPHNVQKLQSMMVERKVGEAKNQTQMPVQVYVTLSRYLNIASDDQPPKRFFVISSNTAIKNPDDLDMVKSRPEFVSAVEQAVQSSLQYNGNFPSDFKRIDVTDFPRGNYTTKSGTKADLSKKYVFLKAFTAKIFTGEGAVRELYVPEGLLLVRPYTFKTFANHKREVIGGERAIATALFALRALNDNDLEKYEIAANDYIAALTRLKKHKSAIAKGRNVKTLVENTGGFM